MAWNKLSMYMTAIVATENGTQVIYRGTPIVIFNEREIRLNTGGWKSVTTKRKMNQTARQFNLPYSVFQAGGVWYVRHDGTCLEFVGREHTILLAGGKS